MNIERIELILPQNTYPMTREGDLWQYKDVTVSVTPGGTVTVSARETPISYLRISLSEERMENCLVLGDAWERAYADLHWKKPNPAEKLPWYFFAYDGEQVLCCGVKTQPNALCYWQYDGHRPVLTADLRSGTDPLLLSGRRLTVCTIVTDRVSGDLHACCAAFCRRLCDDPRTVSRPIFGGNDWYCNYGNNSYEKIKVHAQRIAKCAENCTHTPYMVIDDGWQLCHRARNTDYNGGPWGFCNSNFGSMQQMAQEIVSAGAIPGIWMRPLETMEKLPEHYWLKRDFPNPTLDPSVPEVLELIKRDVRTIVSWGYRLIKHDFSSADLFGKWGFEMGDELHYGETHFADTGRTTAEIIKAFYLAIREAAGDDVLIMGCNTFSHLSAGIMDIQRTGDDTSGREWERTKKYGVNTLAFRMMQHGAFYQVDADCVGITCDVPWEKNAQWLDVLAKSGTPLFVSIGEDAFTPQVEMAIRAAFETADRTTHVSTPVDWLETKTPRVWDSQLTRDTYDW